MSPFHLLSLFPLLVGFDAEKQKQLIHFWWMTEIWGILSESVFLTVATFKTEQSHPTDDVIQ